MALLRKLGLTAAATVSGALTDDAMWCPGVPPPRLKEADGLVDVIYAQAALFSTNPAFGDALGKYNLFHTALVLQQKNMSWTLEFDLSALNKPNASMGAGFVPKIHNLELIWDNAARWCLTEGILHGREHWKETYEVMAQVTASQLDELFQEAILPRNGTAGQAPFYNAFHILRTSQPTVTLINDVTCANGAIWVRDHLQAMGVAVRDLHYKVTRFNVNADDVRPVDTSNATLWKDVVSFYSHFDGVLNQFPDNAKEFPTWLLDLSSIFPLRYVYDGNRSQYFEVLGNREPWIDIAFDAPPSPWIPSPPAPPAPPMTTTTTTLPPAMKGIREICVENEGGYVLKWWLEVNGTRVSESDTYPIGQTHCISGADAGATDEDSLGCHVKAIWGKTVPCVEGSGKKTSSHKYGSQSSKRARYKCTKTTTLIECMFAGLESINSDVQQMSGVLGEGSSVVV